ASARKPARVRRFGSRAAVSIHATSSFYSYGDRLSLHSFPTRRSSDLLVLLLAVLLLLLLVAPCLNCLEAVKKPPPVAFKVMCLLPIKIGRAVQQECRDRSRMPSSA